MLKSKAKYMKYCKRDDDNDDGNGIIIFIKIMRMYYK